ncbi:MAG: response regulator [Rhodobacteraceae bacterium]|jgi:CheY-like chemotaxis protein|nr:response regulator [Paracoccaceae bacterium]MCZ8088485.1 response regulator [Paracoccaceae bacterium]
MTTSSMTGGLRVLLADDNPINLQILTSFLRRLGHVVTTAETGREAVEKWEPNQFDLLCFDISMPELDGIAALKQIEVRAKAARAPAPPALTITANAQPHQLESYLAAGFRANLPKPVRRLDLDQIINGLSRST